MYIYVIRHGQTDWNVEHKLLSHTDLPLNEEGRRQCEEAQKVIKNLDYNLVISSPRLRTRQTLEIVNTKNIETIFDDRLVERDVGEFEGRPDAEYNAYRYYLDSPSQGQDADRCDGESRGSHRLSAWA